MQVDFCWFSWGEGNLIVCGSLCVFVSLIQLLFLLLFFFLFGIIGWNPNEWTIQWWATCVSRVTALQFLLNENFQVKRRNPLIHENFSSCKRQEYSIPSISILLQLILFSYDNSFTVGLSVVRCVHHVNVLIFVIYSTLAHGTQKGNDYSAIRGNSRSDMTRARLYANSSSSSSTTSCDSELESLLTPTDNSVVSPVAEWLVCYF